MKLAEIAEKMIAFARQQPYTEGQPLRPYRHELPRGLALVYLIEAGQHHLALTRPRVPPSEFEVDICRQAFNVPAWAERHDRQKGDYHHVAISWRETEPESALLTVEFPAAPWLAVPAGRWRRAGDKIVVEYQDQAEAMWCLTLSKIAKEVDESRAAGPEQISMFGTPNQMYGG